MCKYLVLLVLCTALPTQVARADFFVQIKNASPTDYAPGDTGTLEVWGRHNETSAINLNGWTLSFDLSTNGVWDLVSTSAVANPLITNSTMSYFNDPSYSPDNYDFGFRTTSNDTFSMSANTDIKLFDINFKISNSAGTGTYSLSFVDAALNNFLPVLPAVVKVDANSVAYNGGSQFLSPTSNPKLLANPVVGFQGQFTITAVPEPSSLALVGLVGIGMGLYRRRRS